MKYFGTMTDAKDLVNKGYVDSKMGDVVDIVDNVIAPKYSNSSTYTVGDYVIYQTQLYRCRSNISTAEAWNSSHWTLITVTNELKSIKSDIVDINNDIDELEDYTTELDRTRYGEILQFRDSRTISGLTWKWNNTDFAVTGRATEGDAYYYLFNNVTLSDVTIERTMAFTGSATNQSSTAISDCFLIIRFYAVGSEVDAVSYSLKTGYINQQITVPSNADSFSMYLWVQQSLSTDVDYTGSLKLYGFNTGTMIGDTFNGVADYIDKKFVNIRNNLFTDAIKTALLNLVQNVAYINGNGQAYYNSLYNSLYDIGVVSISAVFDAGSNVIYTDDSLDILRQYLTVTATYADSTSNVVAGYELSGILVAGNSTITVTYGGKTTTCVVSGVVDWYNIYTWSLGANIESIDGGGLIDNTTHDLTISHTAAQLAGRRTFVVTRGKQQYLNYQTREPMGVYPIPIPANAVKATINIMPNSQYIAPQAYVLSSSGYSLDEYASWTQGSVELNLTPEASKFLLVSSKYDSAGTSYPVEPSSLTVTFQ